jgi:hypothetical protein
MGRAVHKGKVSTYLRDYERYFKTDRVNEKRKPVELRKSFQITEMHEIHHEIARLLVLGHKPKDVAEHLKVSYSTVINVKNSPIVIEKMELLRGARDAEVVDVAKQIRELAPKAVEVLTDIIEDDDEATGMKMKASLAILDRAGHGVPKNVNVRGVHAIVSKDDLMAIKQRAVEIGLNAGVIDVESS